MAKHLYIFAGPNGSGKSTLIAQAVQGLEVVNPDIIQQNLPPHTLNPERVAARMALIELEQRLRRSDNFVVETTLTGNVERRLFDQPKQLGWTIHLHFVCLKRPELNILRVRQRKTLGGHFIPADVVSRRYERSLENLPKVLPKADVTWLFDNSSRTGFDLIARFQQGAALYRAETLPAWAKAVLG